MIKRDQRDIRVVFSMIAGVVLLAVLLNNFPVIISSLALITGGSIMVWRVFGPTKED